MYICITASVYLCVYVYVYICIYVSLQTSIYVLLCSFVSRHRQDPITNHAHQESNHKPITKFVIGRRGVPNVDIEFFFF